MNNRIKKVIIIGASSGIGEELARVFGEKGFVVGVTGRRSENLKRIREELYCPDSPIFTKTLDISKPEEAIDDLKELIEEMGGMDIFVMNAGVGNDNQELDWDKERVLLETNIFGFTALTTLAFNYFKEQSCGHIVGVSSIAGLRGNRISPAYSASKSFKSRYLEGLRQKAYKLDLPIFITDIRPGFVNTRLAKRQPVFFTASVKKAAKQIYRAIRKKKSHAYITKRWIPIAWLLKLTPSWIYNRL